MNNYKISMLIIMILLASLLVACNAGSNENNESMNHEAETKDDQKSNSQDTSTSDDKEIATEIKVEDGRTQPVFSHEDAIVETVYIQSPVDSDNDGEKDLIYADIMRPKATQDELKVPAVYVMSPYFEGLNEIEFHDVDVELDGKPFGKVQDKFRGKLDDFLVPRGYAMIEAHAPGTGLSEGCPSIGGDSEVAAGRAVIDWLNGKAKAFDENGDEVKASWSTGKAGMMGVSYNGTIPNALAAEGVEGLETIIPISAISNWYGYYRANGLVVAPEGYQGEDADVLAKAVLTRENPETCSDAIDSLVKKQDRDSADYNDFWDKRNYTKNANNVKASVFIVHGLNDWNVKTSQFSQWWGALSKHDVPRKLWLHQGGHGGVSRKRGEEWYSTMNKWFDHWLYDVDNGIMDTAMVEIERENNEWKAYEDWPGNDPEVSKLHLNLGSEGKPGLIGENKSNNKAKSYTIVDDSSLVAKDLIKNLEESNQHRLAYVTTKLKESVRISGRPIVNIHASINQSETNLTALLVDYNKGSGEIVTRGWMDPQNRKSLSEPKDVVSGKTYKLQWNLQPDDYIFEAGHQIGLVLISSDYNYTLRPDPGAEITVQADGAFLTLPVVGEMKTSD
ncbi:Xaa-Pro dipeptidyl-peptidase [Pontibacillus marinus]|uniref:Xaa-Pro dipeptidyl-peptidase n=1 Tax=Pontibacillus marinus BH030004 = DSM 16465 TaxID=1385511 RepID=A0A0A5GFY8_9BACI|nr:hypothetical protein N783_01185 [Pontibacillus marinus BH030004 = DSM 16465]